MSVDLNLSGEQRQIVASVQHVLADRFPLSRFRNTRGGDCDRAMLAEVAALGWFGLGVDERQGGAGFGLVEEVLLFRELGRNLVTPSVLAGVLGVHLALALGQTGLAAGIMSGRVHSALTTPLQGANHAALDSAGADGLLVWENSRFAWAPADGLNAAESGKCIDRTISLRRIALAGKAAFALEGDAASALWRRADLLVSAQLLGMAEQALDAAVDYAKLRQQFGQPIGAFQAIKHRCADMKMRVKVLGSLVPMAALAEQDGQPDAPHQVAAARMLATRYAVENGAAGIQIHGAMGFTAECDAHLFLLRAHLLENLGSTARARDIAFASMNSLRAEA